MEAFLRSVQSRLTEEQWEPRVHVVLGGPQPDVDSVAATLSLALHLSLKQQTDELVVPVLCPCRGEAPLPHDTRSFLGTLGLSEGLLLWKNHVDLSSLQDQRRLSLTLLREGLLQSSDLYALQSSVQRVVHRRGQRDEEAGSSAVTTVAREILQEAPEHVGSALGPALRGTSCFFAGVFHDLLF